MAKHVRLGEVGDIRNLPHLKFIGNPPAWPVTTNKQIEKARMSDKSLRVAFFGTKKVFQLKFGFLSSTELTLLKYLNGLNKILRYMNEFEEIVWYNVVLTSFSHDPERTDIRNLERYLTSMTLEEI